MRIKTVRLQNFRGFVDETVHLNPYTCIVGPNGAGKSTILAALNVFFKERTPLAPDISRLTADDCFKRDTSQPIRITLVLHELNTAALTTLRDYVRNGELIVTFEAFVDPAKGWASGRYFGQRMGIESFRRFFDAQKNSAKAADLALIYDELRTGNAGLPERPRSMDKMATALREFESANPDHCAPIPSEDEFYGIGAVGKLNPFIQWIYVPAVKEASAESIESKGTAFGKLMARVVRARTTFTDRFSQLKSDLGIEYQKILDENAGALEQLSLSLRERLAHWAHADVKLSIQWGLDASSVSVEPPLASIRTGEGEFLADVARMGHGLQRSFLLAILQELSEIDGAAAPTLALGCEEPELYQHPPQARHLADTLERLTSRGSQVIITTHSPLFVSGESFGNVRLLRRDRDTGAATARGVTPVSIVERIRQVRGEDLGRRIDGVVAKIHQMLQPSMAEMFFARVSVLVEGQEDVAYITSQLHLSDRWEEFRKQGCHLVPVGGKDKLVQAAAIASALGMPFFVVFDADGHARADHRGKHEKDNIALCRLVGAPEVPFPTDGVFAANHVIWEKEIGPAVEADFDPDDFRRFKDTACQHYANEGDLHKNGLFIADLLMVAKAEGKESRVLAKLCDSIIAFAGNH